MCLELSHTAGATRDESFRPPTAAPRRRHSREREGYNRILCDSIERLRGPMRVHTPCALLLLIPSCDALKNVRRELTANIPVSKQTRGLEESLLLLVRVIHTQRQNLVGVDGYVDVIAAERERRAFGLFKQVGFFRAGGARRNSQIEPRSLPAHSYRWKTSALLSSAFFIAVNTTSSAETAAKECSGALVQCAVRPAWHQA